MTCYRCGEVIESEDKIIHGLHEKCFVEWFALEGDENFKDVTIKSAISADPKEEDHSAGMASSFFQGKFKKYSAELNGKKYILKVKDDKFPELPGVEFLCNNIAVFFGINVPKFYFIKFENSLETFVSKNFMPDFGTADLVHIYHFFKKGEEFSFEVIINILKKQTERLEDVNRFVELCFFDALIGNHDRHGRNLAIVRKAKKCFLSPFYDNPAYLGTEEKELLGAIHEPKGKIAVKNTIEPSIKDYYREAKRLGYLDVAANFIKKIDLKEIKKLIDDAFISSKRKKAFFSLVERRYAEVGDEIQK
ncbi:MAG: HipA domain-containing protein [Candidatus Omnitrophica bacterium]|nr:HipA domain-containing protein [Candidatus Omnitrophota bacterium]